MRFFTLNEWLDWQQTLHWQEIELGLERIQQVARRLNITSIARQTIIVAGTNGKGSTVACYTQLLQASGYSVGAYTSPHLMRYNERICINGECASDEQIMQAFEQIDQARQEISLSYFEFGTLAALLCIRQADVDVAVLEVGLGGRLDAVNIIDADLVHFTPIGIDHTVWLGETRELIALEKAGVLRPHCQVICNDAQPPDTLVEQIKRHTNKVLFIQKDYFYDAQTDTFCYAGQRLSLHALALAGAHQKLNCCGVLAGLSLLHKGDFFHPKVYEQALSHLFIKGRFETIDKKENCKTIVDVGHNADAARVLVAQLQREEASHCVMVLGMLEDKNVTQFTEIMSTAVEHCICIGLEGDRALSAHALSVKINANKLSHEIAHDMPDALNKAEHYLAHGVQHKHNKIQRNIILITGSFHTVEAYLSSI